MKEIGGYLELENLIQNEYHSDAIALNSGRNCLKYLVKAKKIEKLYIPYFICGSINSIADYCKIEYYNIDFNFIPLIEKTILDKEYVYIVNYYGQYDNDYIILLKEKYKNIIVDNVQAFFQKPVDGIDTIYSCRKFFGVPDGAYLYTDTIIKNDDIEIDSSRDRFEHLLGRYEEEASKYFEKYKLNEEKIDNLPLRYMSKLTHNIMGAIDYEKVVKIRNDNFSYLKNALHITNNIEIKNIQGAYVYPYYVENSQKLRKELINNKVYIATLWSNILENISKDWIEYKLAYNILPLPCDQRNRKKDMEYIVSIINNFGG